MTDEVQTPPMPTVEQQTPPDPPEPKTTDAPADAEPVEEGPWAKLRDWPSVGYDGPQPWEHDELGIAREERDAIGTDENTVTPTVSHSYPILTSGSADPVVHELGRKLGQLGFPNSVSRGENPFGTVDGTVLQATQSFRQQYGVRPDPSGFGGNTPAGRRLADDHLDPWTVEAILRAHENR